MSGSLLQNGVRCTRVGAPGAARKIRSILLVRLRWKKSARHLIHDRILQVLQGAGHRPVRLDKCRLCSASEEEGGGYNSFFTCEKEIMSVSEGDTMCAGLFSVFSW